MCIRDSLYPARCFCAYIARKSRVTRRETAFFSRSVNSEDVYKRQGSAIFLHCPKTANNTGTSGCISIPEEYMKLLVQSVDQNTKIIVVQNEKELASY